LKLITNSINISLSASYSLITIEHEGLFKTYVKYKPVQDSKQEETKSEYENIQSNDCSTNTEKMIFKTTIISVCIFELKIILNTH
jgi:hypothetical protein